MKCLGHFLIIGIPGFEIPSFFHPLVERYDLFGVILFQRNFKNPEQLKQLIKDLKAAKSKYHESPLLIFIDHEGGNVTRFPDSVVPWFPSSSSQGKWGSPEITELFYTYSSIKLRQLGIDVNLAPMVDLEFALSPLKNRPFSKDDLKVSLFGKAALDGIEKGSLLGCLKHFPGLGSVEMDTHFDTGLLNKTIKDLKDNDWTPYKKLLSKISHHHFLMVAHALTPLLPNKQQLSSLNPIINQYIREDLGYEGLIITDDLSMEAVKKRTSLNKAFYQTILAGGDIAIIGHDWAQVSTILDQVNDHIKDPKALQDHISISESRKRKFYTSINKISTSKLSTYEDQFKKARNKLIQAELSGIRPLKKSLLSTPIRLYIPPQLTDSFAENKETWAQHFCHLLKPFKASQIDLLKALEKDQPWLEDSQDSLSIIITWGLTPIIEQEYLKKIYLSFKKKAPFDLLICGRIDLPEEEKVSEQVLKLHNFHPLLQEVLIKKLQKEQL